MICFKCSGEVFNTQNAIIRQDFRGELLDVSTPVSVCAACGWQTLGRGQTDELRKRTADAYRRNHNLLTSAEIVAYRNKLKMSQGEFADFLKVGVASVKRWETWQVQDQSSDELIRVKCEFHPACREPLWNLHIVVTHVSIHTDLSQRAWPRPIRPNVGFHQRTNLFEENNEPESVPIGDLAVTA